MITSPTNTEESSATGFEPVSLPWTRLTKISRDLDKMKKELAVCGFKYSDAAKISRMLDATAANLYSAANSMAVDGMIALLYRASPPEQQDQRIAQPNGRTVAAPGSAGLRKYEHSSSLPQYHQFYHKDIAVMACIEYCTLKSDAWLMVGHVKTFLKKGECALTLRQIQDATGLTCKSVRCSITRLNKSGEISSRAAGNRYTVFALSL